VEFHERAIAADVRSAGELCGREIPRESRQGLGDGLSFNPGRGMGGGRRREDKWAAFIAEFMRARACLICGEDLEGRRYPIPFNPLRSPCRRPKIARRLARLKINIQSVAAWRINIRSSSLFEDRSRDFARGRALEIGRKCFGRPERSDSLARII